MRKLVDLCASFFGVLRAVDSKAFYFALFMSGYNFIMFVRTLVDHNLAMAIFSCLCLVICVGCAAYIFQLKLYKARAKKPFPKYEEKK